MKNRTARVLVNSGLLCFIALVSACSAQTKPAAELVWHKVQTPCGTKYVAFGPGTSPTSANYAGAQSVVK